MSYTLQSHFLPFQGVPHERLPADYTYTGAILTPTWLIWARSGAKSGTVVSAARLAEIECQNLDPRLAALGGQLEDEQGLNVFGFVNRSPERVSAYIGLGQEAAAGRFKREVKEAVARVRG